MYCNLFSKLPFVKKVYKSDANFLLVKVGDPVQLYDYLAKNKIVIRDRSKVTLCEGCLRFTIGTKEENNIVMDQLMQYK